MSHLSTTQLAKLSGLTKRQIQRILASRSPDLGAQRTPGGHWIIPDTPRVRRWAKDHHKWKPAAGPKPRLNAGGKAKGFVSIEGVALSFQAWLRTVDHLVPRWQPEQVERAMHYLEPMARFYAELAQRSARHSSGNASTAERKAAS